MEVLRRAPGPMRPLVIAVAVIALLHVVAFAALQVLQRTTTGVLPGVTVRGHDVEGLDQEDLRRTVQRIADDDRSQPVVVTAEGQVLISNRRAVGSRLDVASTVDAAWRVGRRGLWRALVDHVSARAGRKQEVAEPTIDDEELERWAGDAAEELSRSPRPPRVGFVVRDPPDDVELDVTEGRDGHEVDAQRLRRRLRAELQDPGPVHVDAPVDAVPMAIDERDVDAVRGPARRAVSAPVVLENPTRGDDLELSPEDLAAVLEVRPDESRPPGRRLELHLEPDDLADHVRIEDMEVNATEARFDIVGGEVRILGGRRGFEVDVEQAAERILDLADEDPPRVGDMPGERKQPQFSRSDAEELGIEERVSSFTTEYDCCPPRVQNIHLIADMVDGALIRPGERFEVNDHVGPRTRERGFVAAPAIVRGEFVDVVGGGVSQFATTFFNAAFFAGIELDEFQPHSYYFERYPMGNEATISWQTIDLAVVNDSPHGILVETSYTNTSVTVAFWSSEWAEVSIERDGPRNVREGERRNGFDITVRRIIEYPGGTREVEEYFHRYQPQD